VQAHRSVHRRLAVARTAAAAVAARRQELRELSLAGRASQPPQAADVFHTLRTGQHAPAGSRVAHRRTQRRRLHAQGGCTRSCETPATAVRSGRYVPKSSLEDSRDENQERRRPRKVGGR